MHSRDVPILAFVLSVVLHVGLLVGPGWGLPQQDERSFPRLEARLLQNPTAPAVAAPVRRKTRRTARPKPHPVQDVAPPDAAVATLPPISEPQSAEALAEMQSEALAEALAEAQTAPQSTPLADQSGPSSAPVVNSADTSAPSADVAQGDPVATQNTKALADWVHDGCVKYVLNVQYGILRGEFGQAEQCWQHDDASYFITLSGSAAIAWKRFQIEQTSAGGIVNGLMMPDDFRETTDNKHYETVFDAAGDKVRQTRNGETRELPTGGVALDMLALMHFMSMQPDDAQAFDMFVVASRGTVSRVTVMQRSNQPIDLPTGTAIARQFHAEARNGELKIDVWIARTLRNTPVRFRIDNKGDIFDFQAIDVTADGQNLARRPEKPPEPPPSPFSD